MKQTGFCRLAILVRREIFIGIPAHQEMAQLDFLSRRRLGVRLTLTLVLILVQAEVMIR